MVTDAVMIKPTSCPVCRRQLPPETPDSFPFCSDRCRNVDFFRWCDGRYAIVEQLDPQTAELLAMDGEIEVEPAPEE